MNVEKVAPGYEKYFKLNSVSPRIQNSVSPRDFRSLIYECPNNATLNFINMKKWAENESKTGTRGSSNRLPKRPHVGRHLIKFNRIDRKHI